MFSLASLRTGLLRDKRYTSAVLWSSYGKYIDSLQGMSLCMAKSASVFILSVAAHEKSRYGLSRLLPLCSRRDLPMPVLQNTTQLDSVTERCPDCKELVTLIRAVCMCEGERLSLSAWARHTIRSHARVNMLQAVDKLPLPSNLKLYLLHGYARGRGALVTSSSVARMLTYAKDLVDEEATQVHMVMLRSTTSPNTGVVDVTLTPYIGVYDVAVTSHPDE